MPVYEYYCNHCRGRFDKFHKLADYAKPTTCPQCGGLSEKLLSAPAVVGDYEGYECPVSGKWVEGRRQHEENLKRTGCRVFEPGERESLIRRKAAEEAALDRAVEETVDAAIEAMPTRKREQLVQELQGGADVKVERQTVNASGGV